MLQAARIGNCLRRSKKGQGKFFSAGCFCASSSGVFPPAAMRRRRILRKNSELVKRRASVRRVDGYGVFAG